MVCFSIPAPENILFVKLFFLNPPDNCSGSLNLKNSLQGLRSTSLFTLHTYFVPADLPRRGLRKLIHIDDL